jgi:probable F420-dependent oxidoreductase
MEIAFNMAQTAAWFDGDIHGVLDLVDIADDMGIDLVSLPEHVVMGEDFSGYPYRPRIFTSKTDFYEPIVMLAAMASRTRRIRLGTGVLLLPLRSAVLIAKQIATLDILSRGRVELAVGTGWQKAEYDFAGLPWEGRFGRMMETIEACRVLWSESPASYAGRYVRFDRAYSHPFPVQGRDIPFILGVGPSPINLERLARIADGWSPLGISDDVLLESMATIGKLRAQYDRRGSFTLKLLLPPVRVKGIVDIDASLAQLPYLADLGCTQVNIDPFYFCANAGEFADLITTVLAARASFSDDIKIEKTVQGV